GGPAGRQGQHPGCDRLPEDLLVHRPADRRPRRRRGSPAQGAAPAGGPGAVGVKAFPILAIAAIVALGAGCNSRTATGPQHSPTPAAGSASPTATVSSGPVSPTAT